MEQGRTMPSHKSSAGRIPRLKDVASQSPNGPSPVMTAPEKLLVSSKSSLSRIQSSKRISLSTRGSRASSLSEAEDIRQVPAPTRPTNLPSSHEVRSYLPSRTVTHLLPSALPQSARLIGGHKDVQTPLADPEPQNAVGREKKEPIRNRPRNVLRRKAPTIGQHTAMNREDAAESRPEKLNLVIPNISRQNSATELSTGIGNRSHLTSPSTQYSPLQKTTNEPPEQRFHGPKELASLRTTLNMQNLPPPTPAFASASSPSTRYSSSPGVWSRTSTPTTLSSASPGIVQPAKGSRLRQPSPYETRLPGFSPQTSSASQGGSLDRKAFGSPIMKQTTGSMISLGKETTEENTAKLENGRAAAGPSSMLPRGPSAQSNLPRVGRPSVGANQTMPKEVKSSAQPRRPSREDGLRVVTSGSLIPSRPSRYGTHRLEQEPSPVVKSNISPGTVTSHKRRDSLESSPNTGSTYLAFNKSATSVNSAHSRSSSRAAMPRTPTSPEASRKALRTLTKDQKTQKSPSPEKTRKFGLFPKKSKPELDTSSDSRSARKGPAAGTGHEGYGRYAHRGRRSSITSSDTSRERSTSTTSSTTRSATSRKGSVPGAPELDDFLLNRLEPVVINGGGGDGASLARTQSEQSIGGFSTASTASLVAVPGHSTESLGMTRSAGDTMTAKWLSTSQASANGSSNTNASDVGRPAYGSPPTLKAQESQSANSKQLRPQETIATRFSAMGLPDGKQHQKKKPTKRGLGLKLPFFQKSHKPANSEPPSTSTIHPSSQVRAMVKPSAQQRPVAHYAIVDSDLEPLEDVIRTLEESPLSEEPVSPVSPVEVPAALNVKKPSQSILLPSPPKLEREFSGRQSPSKVYFTQRPNPQEQERSPEDSRPSRLASIGRIPRVVSKRDRQHRPAMESFSRPFSVIELPSIPAPVTDRQTEISPSSRVEPDNQNNQQSHNGIDAPHSSGPSSKANPLDFLSGPYSKNEFFTMAPRKDSIHSTSNSSESSAAVTAQIPQPHSALTEDEIWREFDEFIDHVLYSPETTRSMTSNEHEADERFQLATRASRTLQVGMNRFADNRVPAPKAENPTVAFTPASPGSSNGSIRLRRSRIAAALHSSFAPSAQQSYSDLIASYERDDNCSEDRPGSSTPTPPADSHHSVLSLPSLNPSPSFETCRQRNTVMFDIAERDREGPTAQTNIRSGSLMTSRWLSFGRVLFSPAHNHVSSGEREKILVIDGLGNDDWSFYCSLTYPNADVYHLSDGPAPTASKHPAAWLPPSNHHTIQHASLETQFPFPRGFFAATILRFPAASPESIQCNIVAECKRVLRPGGYMEMSVLDLDMVNMGIRTRKAVRKLKERTYLSDPSISLKPASDSVQRLLGKHGFDNLRRCMVRIPVVGLIVRSSGSSSGSSSHHPTRITTATPSTIFSMPSTSSIDVQTKFHGKSSSNDTDLSLGDLLSDPSPSPSNDESIRKIVARVGRWWYTRCYEIPVLPNGDISLSIWAERKVLRECQQRGTGFRLLIAYAQKPSEKRRTASV
ncbi:hypothetical protein P168DRAFT_52337 [Aspergillus campestris IBT 28561]|uniref:Methyltransferase type 11 domain-containing protein n=1 Tax=Aspergillus campestris (strain IBT 28561) TaxID=1392248 RepID=A0A2I1CVB7_ASPC2|nr:uncharacterized protein P168DRAFT_52337 [Aspergillus campestris IBT 28561]PKY01559.1 hypothetical protein P168DRAFT_52337 [Aspergillus campestris IBT 28561]